MLTARYLLKTALHRRAAIILAGLLTIAGLSYLAYADLTQPLTATVQYPPSTFELTGATISGSATQQVFRLDSSAPEGIFAGLNPKTGATCASGGTICFLSGGQATINANDFVYAIQVTAGSESNRGIEAVLEGLGSQATVTSVGYMLVSQASNPSSSNQPPSSPIQGVTYGFGAQPILSNQQSAILFYTSPNPPGLHPTSIAGGGASSQSPQAIYGAYPTSIAIDKKLGLSASGPFTDGQLSAVEGAPVYYQITVQNTGQSPLKNITVTDPQIKVSGDLTADFFAVLPGQLAPGATVTKVFGPFAATSGQPVPGVSVKGVNTASTSAEYLIPSQNGSDSGQTFSVSGSDSVMLNVVQQADLSVTKTASPDPVLVGSTLTYTITVTNNGPSPAIGVTLTDTLPPGVTVISSPCTQSNNTLTCNLGNLGNNESVSVTIVIVPTAPGAITNTASVSSSTSDPNPANDSISQSTTVNPTADLSITKTHSGSFTIGGTGSYTLTVTNAADAGPTTGAVTVTDTLPGNLTLTGFSGAGWNCAGLGTPNVSCTNASALAAGASLPPLTLTVNVGTGTPTGAGSVTNTAGVSTPGEINTANNTASDATTINKATPAIEWANPADIVYGTALGGTQLNATAIFNGASVPGTFTYSPASGTLLDAGNNQALSVNFTPTDTANFNSASASVQINVLKATPVINWSNPADIVYGTPLGSAQLNATAVSNGASVPGAFTYTPAAGTILNAGAGQMLSVSFSPTDANNFNSATASVQINVLKATPTINWNNPADIVYGTPLGNSQLNATAVFNGANVDGTFNYTPMAGTILNAGNNQTLSVNFTPADTTNFNGASASVEINVLKATPAINWNNPADIVYGTPLGGAQLNATASFNGANVPGSFSYTPSAGTVLNAGSNQPLSVDFIPADAANFNSASANVVINVLKATPAINWNNPADIVYGTPLGSAQLNATVSFNGAAVPGTITYTPAAGAVLNAGNNQTLSASFTPTDAANFNTASASVAINVLKATPVINWDNPADIVYGTPLSSTQLNATAVFNGANVPGNFTYTPPGGTVLNAGNNQSLSVSFTPTDAANFNSASASVVINVLKATPIINWSNPAEITYGTALGGAQLNATASFNGASVPGSFTYTPASGTVLNAGSNQPLSVSFTPTNTTNFNSASASVQINVLKATPVINWSNPADIVYGTPLGSTQLNAAAVLNGATVAGSFSYTPPAGVMLNAGSNQPLSASFTPTDTANFNNASASVVINVLKATPAINWGQPADIIYGTLLGNTQLNATAAFNGASLPGSFNYNPSTGTTLNPGMGQTLSTMFTPDDTANFNQAPANTPINVLGGSNDSVSTTITYSGSCVGAGTILTVTSKVTNNGLSPQGDNPGPEFVAQLPAQVTLTGTCDVQGGVCTTNASQVVWNGTIGVGETVTIKYKVRVKDTVQPGASICIVAQASYDSDADGTNDATASTTECTRADCRATECTGADCPQPGPGLPIAAGSVLVYNFYSSHPANPNAENTRLNITNTDATRTAVVHFFFVDGRSCSVADSFLCLTPNQTASFLASDIDPGVTGYGVAVAVDKDTGCPINLNALIGDEYIKLASGHAANLPAEAFAALYDGALPGCDATSSTAVIAFDGTSYSQAPRTLALDQISSPVDGNQTLLILNRLGGDLQTSASSIGAFFGILYDDIENGFSFTATGGCQFRQELSNSFPRVLSRLSNVIPSGRIGWMKLWAADDVALLGAAINFNPNTAALPTAFSQGHNLHKLTLAAAASLIIPVTTPFC